MLRELSIKLKYKKHHQIFSKSFKNSQVIQRDQKKTFDSLIFTNYNFKIIKPNQLEALRRAISKKVERLLRFHVFKQPNLMVTAKPREIRMGKGKGSFSHWQTALPLGGRVIILHWCHYGYLIPKLTAFSGSLKKTGLLLRGL